jgi:hypothetical protein
MGSMLRLVTVVALALLILLPLWDGGAAVSSAVNAKGTDPLSQIGLPSGFDGEIIARLQDVRSEIRSQQCARGAQNYCVLGRCWTIAAPINCAAPAGAGAGQLSVGH